jgi:hypothetical protein
MESSERRSFGSRQGEKSDAVQAPLAFRDDVRGPKNQVQAIAEKTSFSWFYLTAGGVFSALTSSKPSTDATASLCGLLLVRCEKSIHSDCFQLNKTRSRTGQQAQEKALPLEAFQRWELSGHRA